MRSPRLWMKTRLPRLANAVRALRTPTRFRSYSVQGEDLLVLDLLDGTPRDRRRYVDVGAYDPVYASNTYLLYRLGWQGLAVEPNAGWRPAWRSVRPRDDFLCAAVTPQGNQTALRLLDDQTTTRPADGTPDAPETTVPALRLDDALRREPKASFLSIDIEGPDLEVLTASRLAPQVAVILVETHHLRVQDALADARISAWMKDSGCQLVGHNRRNLVFASAEHFGRLEARYAGVYRALNPRSYG